MEYLQNLVDVIAALRWWIAAIVGAALFALWLDALGDYRAAHKAARALAADNATLRSENRDLARRLAAHRRQFARRAAGQ